MKRRELLARILPAWAALEPIARISAWAQEARFQTGVTNIQVDASVTFKGQPLLGLARSHFVIRDEGIAESVLTFEDSSTPLDLVLLLGTGLFPNSRSPEIPVALESVRRMRPQDRVAIISFRFDPHLELPLTSDGGKISKVLQQQRNEPLGGGGLLSFEALHWALWLLEADAKAAADADASGARAARKRVILMLFRRRNLDTSIPDDPLIKELWDMDVTFHAIFFGKYRREIIQADLSAAQAPFYRIGNIEHIAKATGGEMLENSSKSVPDVLAGIRSSYSLWYRAPEAVPGSKRRIAVELSDAAKMKYPGAEVRAREGYFAH